jgi:hypothetical protein
MKGGLLRGNQWEVEGGEKEGGRCRGRVRKSDRGD